MPFHSPTPLPDDVIDRLFSALVVRYGTPFLDRWRDLELPVVKADWARELAGFNGKGWAIRYALANLPDKPPTVIEFRKLCNAAPMQQAQPLLPNDAQVRGPNEFERARLAELRGMYRRPETTGDFE